MLPSITEKKQFALHCLAANSFSAVINTCKHILEDQILEDNPIYYPLTISIFIFYGRPFMKNWGFGKLDIDRIIPDKNKSLHTELMIYRDKIYAHSDKNIEHEDFGPVNEVRATISNGRCRFWGQPIMATHIRIHEILELANILHEKMEYRKEKFVKKYQKKIIEPPGEYLLDMEEDGVLLKQRSVEKTVKEKEYLDKISSSYGTFKSDSA